MAHFWKRGDWEGETVQAEALAPDDLAAELRQALEAVIDQDVLQRTIDAEEADRRELLEDLARLEHPRDSE